MKVGILTFQRSVSYGAFFQCYALARSLASMGHEVEVLDYQPPHRANRIKPWVSRRRWIFHKANLVRIPQLRKFRAAITAGLPLSRSQFSDVAELERGSGHLDAVVCGSDQIWNAEHTGGSFDPAYFGHFGKPELLRISYAPSLGNSAVDPKFQQSFVELASGLDVVSVREATGAAAVEKLLGRRCEQMPDPTFLVSDWSHKISKRHAKGEYILSYRLYESDLYNKVVEAVARERRLPVVHLADLFADPPATARRVIPDPKEWLSLVAGAAHFVTNSFHGTVFGIRFHRNLTSVAQQGKEGSKSARVVDMLRTLKLSGLLCHDQGDIEKCLGYARGVDWAQIDSFIEEERCRGLAFLQKALTACRT